MNLQKQNWTELLAKNGVLYPVLTVMLGLGYGFAAWIFQLFAH